MTTPTSNEIAVKAHDRLPVVEALLGFSNGDVADLSNVVSVRFIMRSQLQPNGAPKTDAPAVIVDDAAGHVRYDWAVGDTDTPGVYNAEWEVVYDDGRKQTFPTKSYHKVSVLADLDGE